MPRGESKMSPRRIEAVFKQRQALELRMAGRTWQEIADALGYASHSGAIEAVKSALEKTLKTPADDWRALTIERLTKILQIFWPAMVSRDEKAADKVFRAIADLRSVLGLDAPTVAGAWAGAGTGAATGAGAGAAAAGSAAGAVK